MKAHIGRFAIIRELGRGAQSVVYLARDPRLEREVAIKTLRFDHADAAQNQRLLGEARLVGQLHHPHIVPVFEAGEDDGDPYLVFEYVPGENLAERLQRGGALPAPVAAAILASILDALVHAHASGIIHRDLKPSNILIDPAGVPRVMDFGIAARVETTSTAAGRQEFSGTPAYMAPEYIARRESSERGDVFAAGLVFLEMLSGRRAVSGSDANSLMRRIVGADVDVPADLAAALDSRLLDLLRKALVRDPQRRIESAAQMRELLATYLEPVAETSPEAKQGTIDFLLRRMRHKSDFPALSESIGAINRLAASDRESVAQLSSSILKDFSLTNKILRLVNSACYRRAGGGSISTVSRAVIVLGFDAIRNIAVTVLLFEHLKGNADAEHLKNEFVRANLAGILAKEVAALTQASDVEQAFICSMFHNLGRILSQYYFPEESEEIRKLMQLKQRTEDAAAIQVLGITFEELGAGIARSWGFPPLIVNTMRKLPAGEVRKPATSEERLRVLAGFANELCRVISQASADERRKELRKVSQRFADSVDFPEQQLFRTIEKSFGELSQFAEAIHIGLRHTALGKQIQSWQQSLGGGAGGGGDTTGQQSWRHGAADGDASPVDEQLAGTILSEGVPGGAAGALSRSGGSEEGQEEGTEALAGAAESILTAGIQDISNTLVEDYRLNDLLRIILETIYRAKGFRRVLLCIRDARNNRMVGRFGFGPDAPEVARRFDFPLTGSADIFYAALLKNVDVLITDTDDSKIAASIPEWFRRGVGAGTFVILPLAIKGRAVAMIYADCERAGEIVIAERELSLMRTLRNQALLAIKQSTG